MIYLKLFLSFLQIGCFSFGGGYAAMPLIQEQVVTKNHWMTMRAFTDLVTIAEMTPGPVAVNAATFVGTQTAGFPGAVVATAGCILPSCIFVTALACIYAKYRSMKVLQGTLASLRPAVVAMIAKAGLAIIIPAIFLSGNIAFSEGNIQFRMLLYFAAAVFALRKVKLNPIAAMLLCGLLELLYYFITNAVPV